MILLGLLFIPKSLDTKHSCESYLWTGRIKALHGLKRKWKKMQEFSKKTHTWNKQGSSGTEKGKNEDRQEIHQHESEESRSVWFNSCLHINKMLVFPTSVTQIYWMSNFSCKFLCSQFRVLKFPPWIFYLIVSSRTLCLIIKKLLTTEPVKVLLGHTDKSQGTRKKLLKGLLNIISFIQKKYLITLINIYPVLLWQCIR